MPPVSRKRARPKSAAAVSPGRPSGLDRAETALYTVLLAGIVLAFSTRLQIQFTLPKLLILRATTAALAAIWIARLHRGETRPLPRPVVAAGVLLALWWLITTITAVDRATALDGAHGRFNGLWTNTLLLTLLAVTATSPAPLSNLATRVKVLAGALMIASIYTMIQSAGLDLFVWPFSRPASTIGHPVTLATALGLGAPFALVSTLAAGSRLARWTWGATFVVLVVAAGLTLSRAPLLALAASSALAILLARAPRVASRRTIAAIAALVVLALVVSGAYIVRHRSGRFLPSLAQLTREPEIQNRLHTLRAAAGMLRDHPVQGVGLENYYVLYPRYRPVEAERLTPDSVPTMVHSGYLQLAVTTGVAGLGLYLCFLAAVFTSLARGYARHADRPARLLLAACIASASGYLIADITGWPEVPNMALFCVVLGIGLSAASVEDARWSPPRPVKRFVYAAAVVWTVVLLLLTAGAFRMVRADYAVRTARLAAAAGDWPGALAWIDQVLSLEGSRPVYKDAAASVLAERYGATGDRELYDRSARLFEDAGAQAPFSEYIRIHRIDLETARLQKQKGGTPAQGARDAAAALLAVDLHNGTVYESLARLRLAEGDHAGALEMIARAEALRPQQADYWRIEGDTRRAMGDRPGAVAAYRHAIAGTVPGTAAWLGVERRLIVVLIEIGDYSTAIDEAGRTLALAPGDSLTQRLLDAATEARRARATGS